MPESVRITDVRNCPKVLKTKKESLRRFAVSRIIKYYVDRGYSETNFERPALQEMLTDVKDGLIDLILVKDLSRIGRNHLLVAPISIFIGLLKCAERD